MRVYFSLFSFCLALLLGAVSGCNQSPPTVEKMVETPADGQSAPSETDVLESGKGSDAEEVLAAALSTATKEDKNVIVHLGGPG